MLQGENKEGSFVEHLEELRWALIRVVISVTVLFPVAYYFSDMLTDSLVRLFCPAGMKLRYFSPVEPLMVKLKMSLYVALFVAAPYILRQTWGFLAPGLYFTEKRFAGWLLLISWVLFVIGGAFSMFAILPVVMTFSLGFQTDYLEAAIGFEQFISLISMLVLSFGVMFQCPAAVFLMVRTGIVSLEKMRSLRSVIFVTILIISAILTPPDVFSQMMMAIPTYLLFELGLLAARFFARPPDLDAAKNSMK